MTLVGKFQPKLQIVSGADFGPNVAQLPRQACKDATVCRHFASSHFSFECKAAARTPEFAGPISGAVPSFCAEFGEVMQTHKWLTVGETRA